MEQEKEQFIYVLKLIPTLFNESNWTEKQKEIVSVHFNVLEKLHKDGKIILAGRTLNMDERTFGIVILEVESEKEAQTIMKNDPAVAEGIMTAELFPYRVALIKGSHSCG